MLYFFSKHWSSYKTFLSVCFSNQDVTSITYCYSSQSLWDYSLIFLFVIPTSCPHFIQSIVMSCSSTQYLFLDSLFFSHSPFHYTSLSQNGTLPVVQKTSQNWSCWTYFLFLLIHSLTARLNFLYCKLDCAILQLKIVCGFQLFFQ